MVSTRDPLNAFLDYPDIAVPNAKDGPLSGTTLAVKDIFDVAGYPTGRGNPAWERQAAAAAGTASAVQKLLDAGARFVGKTQTEEFAYSMIGINAHFASAVNSKAPDRVTGGSSSGSAAAVAGGLADIAVGSDTNSSIRAPACFCGLIGLRTTQDRIALDHTMPLSPSFDTFGWFARDAALYEKVGEILLAEDSHASALRRLFRLPSVEALMLGGDEREAYESMLETVEARLGRTAAPFPMAVDMDDVFAAFRPIQGFEAWQAHGGFITSQGAELDPLVRKRFEYASAITASDRQAAGERRETFRRAFSEALGDDGFVVLPTTPGAAPLKARSTDELNRYALRSLKMTSLAGLLGYPQISIPLGSVGGAPFGISLMGPADTDRQLIALARRVMQA